MLSFRLVLLSLLSLFGFLLGCPLSFLESSAQELPQFHNALEFFGQKKAFSQKMEKVRQFAQFEDSYEKALNALNHPDYPIRLWALRILQHMNRETWKPLEIQSKLASSKDRVFLEKKPVFSSYTFPRFLPSTPLKITFKSPSSTFQGSLLMGTQKYLFGANQNSLYFHLQGEETPRLLKWSPFRSANEEVFCEVLCDRQFLAFFVFYTKDVYPKAPSDNKTIIKCFEELFLPFSAGSQDDPIQFQLPSLLTAHEVSAFYDPVLYRITECLSDTNKEVAYEAAQLLARYTQKGGRDYIRRIQECHLPVLERFVKKEELPLILAGIYREKILASFNRESTGGFGHYDGQFLDVTLMGRESTVSLLWEIFAKNNDDLENSAYRILAGQALQELQYTPPWLIEGLGNFFDIVLPQEIQRQVENEPIRQAIREEALKRIQSMTASALYMLGDDSRFASEEARLIENARMGGRFGDPLHAEMELAYFYLCFRMYDKALREYDKTLRRGYAKNRLGIVYYNRACAFAMQRKKAEALEAFRIAVEDCEYSDLDWLGKDRDLDFIRNEPEFIRLVEELQKRFSK